MKYAKHLTLKKKKSYILHIHVQFKAPFKSRKEIQGISPSMFKAHIFCNN